ncbi:MAG: hypothetical protein B7Z16_14110 [Algoriphagus sp. 32-45-6]|nr:MAG: hypothetical protein B7Z16_14110 [Algoriphagus sp. 32-45-6]
MKTRAKLLPALALVLGATLAMAMNFANPSTVNDPKFGESNGEVYDVTNRTVGPGPLQYQCNQATSTCLFEDAELTIPISESDGQFVPGSGLMPIE